MNVKGEICFWGKQLHRQGLTYGQSGNISKKIENKIFVTAHKSYLGYLDEEDILVLDDSGVIIEGEKEPTSELSLHLFIYKQFPQHHVVIHAHPPYTIRYFHLYGVLTPITLEEHLYLSRLSVIECQTPTITDLKSIKDAFMVGDIVVIKDHGVVAVGRDFKYAFALTELLEINARLRLTTALIA